MRLMNLCKELANKRAVLLIFAVLVIFAGCSKQEKQPDNMSLEELKNKALASIEKEKNDDAIACLEGLVALYPEAQDIFEYKFMLADLYLKVGRLEEAYKLYKHYTQYHPSAERTETALYKSILAKFYQTLKVDKSCDNTDTQKALKQCEDYLVNAMYTEHRSDVKDIKYTCERRLIDKEVYVFNTYLRRQKYQSAKNRIDYLRDNFLENHPALEAQILYLEGKLALKQNDHILVKEKAEKLFDKYPESRFAKMAHSMISAGDKTTIL